MFGVSTTDRSVTFTVNSASDTLDSILHRSVYQPISTRYYDPVTHSTVTPLSPLTPLSPVMPSVITKTDPLTVVTPLSTYPYLYNRPYYYEIDTGLDDSSIVQRDVTRHLRFKTLDKWLYDEFPYVLKYLVVENDKVRVVKNDAEKEKNDISKDSNHDVTLKSDYIGENILTEEKTREILKRIMRELNIKWYDLPHRQALVSDVIEKYIHKKLKELI